MEAPKCDHDFKGFEYSKLLNRWVTYCSKCNLIADEKTKARHVRRRRYENEKSPH